MQVPFSTLQKGVKDQVFKFYELDLHRETLKIAILYLTLFEFKR